MKTYTIEFYSVQHFKFTFQCQSVPFNLRAIPENERITETQSRAKFVNILINHHWFNPLQIEFMDRIQRQFIDKECELLPIDKYEWRELLRFQLTEEEFQVLL